MAFVFLKYCKCGGPYALPSDVTMVRPNVAATQYPDKVKQIHSEECRWSDQELPDVVE